MQRSGAGGDFTLPMVWPLGGLLMVVSDAGQAFESWTAKISPTVAASVVMCASLGSLAVFTAPAKGT